MALPPDWSLSFIGLDQSGGNIIGVDQSKGPNELSSDWSTPITLPSDWSTPMVALGLIVRYLALLFGVYSFHAGDVIFTQKENL